MPMKNSFPVLFGLLSLSVVGFAAAAQPPQLVVQTGHAARVNSIAFSPDSRVIASGSDDLTIKLWDAATGKQLRSLAGHTDGVRSVAFSPDGKVVASGSGDITIKMWDAATGRQLRSLKAATSIDSVIFSPDGKRLASCGAQAVQLWDAATGAPLRSFGEPTDSIGSMAFSPDWKVIVSGDNYDSWVKLWDVATGKPLGTLEGYRNGAGSTVAFSPDGKVIASYNSVLKTIKLRDAATGKQLRLIASAVGSIVFSPDGKALAGGGFVDGTVKLWDAATGEPLRSMAGDASFVALAVAYSPDGKVIAGGGEDGSIRLWDAATGRRRLSLTRHAWGVNSVASSPDGRVMAGGSQDGTVKLWDAATGSRLRSLEGHGWWVSSVAFSPDGKMIASGSADKTIRLWDAATGDPLRSLTGHTYTVWSVAFSPDGKTIASCSLDGTIRLWDIATGKQLFSVEDHSDSIAFRPDGKTLVSGGGVDDIITIWDAATGRPLRFLEGDSSCAGAAVACSPDGKVIASGGYDTIKLWDAATGLPLRPLEGHAGPNVKSIAFSPDGKVIAGGSYETIKLWDAATGKPLRALAGHTNWINSVAFSPDGKVLLSGSADATMKLWRTDADTPLATLISLDQEDWVVVTPDNRFDTKSLENMEGLHWVMPDAPFTPLPLEIFMRDYYEPRLLPRLLKCSETIDFEREFKPVRDISTLNRVQPPVKIARVSASDAEGYVNVTVEVGPGEDPPPGSGRESLAATGVYDVRLFRDGQMVGGWPRDGAEKLLQRASEDVRATEALTGEERFLEELHDWQQATEVKPGRAVKTDPRTGMMTLPPLRVKLPREKDVSSIEFSAYGFNEDRVKSRTAKWAWPDDETAKLPKAQPVQPRAYIIAVGVNAYENQDFDLEFTAADARRVSDVIGARLTATGRYEAVIPVTLISDYETRESRRIVTEKQATKDKFHAVLKLLAGRKVDGRMLTGIKNADRLRQATPDDLVLIMYSSHGYADRAGRFYFIPYDTGPGTGKVFTASVRRHSISSDELSLWLQDVDAGEMVLIVDACHSAAAIEGGDFKPGPMGSRGLGQLSYDKGMKILTATQADNVALESTLIKQGLLTYALVRDGIEARQADYKPKDSVINIGEWLSYGVDRVPKLYEELRAGKIQDFGVSAGGQTKIVVAGSSGKSRGKALEEVAAEAKAQQPSLFDFTRRRREVALVK
ncbi:MAG: caspase family protein [Candidatus Aminicenantes bacterium]|nr:caspase family protein [Candidatus Aminicenantes bacterium]